MAANLERKRQVVAYSLERRDCSNNRRLIFTFDRTLFDLDERELWAELHEVPGFDRDIFNKYIGPGPVGSTFIIQIEGSSMCFRYKESVLGLVVSLLPSSITLRERGIKEVTFREGKWWEQVVS